MKKRLDEFKYDEALHVYMHPDYDRKAFAYSDGQEAEDRIYTILNETKDHSIFSQELIAQIKDWPTEYHFSPLRHNLLRHFPFKETDHILELGCGCGAITRQLGESGASLTAVEGSLNRAKCAAARCRDLPNVRVYCGNFQDIAFEKEFDYVTMIGVFEYCPVYFKGDNPVSQCLEVVKSALKGGGKFILAIENRLGLKYFAGIEEDHVGIPFFGIQDLYNRNTAVTFGKVELSSLLAENGFCSIEFQYPFPDYKVPRVVFMESAFNNPGFRPAEIIRQLISRDYSKKTAHLFSENLVWPVLDANKLIPDLSNSFLVITGMEEARSAETTLLGACYTLDRAMKYNIKTEFIENGKENIIVKKSPFIDYLDSDPVLIHRFDDERYYPGINLDAEISKTIYENDFKGYVSKIRLWIDFVVSNGLKCINEGDIYSSTVMPEFIDCVPINLLITPGGLIYIDREWKFMKDFSLTSLLLRYLVDQKQAGFIDKHLKGKGQPSGKLLNYLGIKFNDEVYREFMVVYDKILKLVYPEAVTATPLFGGKMDSLKGILNLRLLIQKIKSRFGNVK